MSELKTIPEVKEPCILSIIQSAVLAKDVDVDKLKQILDLKRTYDAEKARTSYFSAMCGFQSEMPQVKQKKNGAHSEYAPLCDITLVANPFLAQNSLSYRFEQKTENEIITLKCVITHKDGHYESTQLSAHLVELKGGGNDLQRLGATVTYLRRYTFCSILGITTADTDSDGRIDVPECFISIEQLDELEELIKPFAEDRRVKLFSWLKIDSLVELPVARFEQTKRSLIKGISA